MKKLLEKMPNFMKVSTVVAMFWDARIFGLLSFDYFLGVKRPQKLIITVRFSKKSE